MTVTVHWYDGKHTILLIQYLKGWSLEDAATTIATAQWMIRHRDHAVHVVVDFSNEHHSASAHDYTLNARQLAQGFPRLFLVRPNIYTTTALRVLNEHEPSAQRFKFAESLNDALTYLSGQWAHLSV